jgi:hypothetical protein
MKYQDITLVLGVDAQHLQELRQAWPDWMKFKPELREMPCLVFYDVKQVRTSELKFLREHPKLRLIAWDLPHARSQREKMLAGFVQVPAREVQTPWYLKLDTDAVATGPGEWIKPEWFQSDEHGELPVFIASPWGYSKPRYVMDVLDDWADSESHLIRAAMAVQTHDLLLKWMSEVGMMEMVKKAGFSVRYWHVPVMIPGTHNQRRLLPE